MKDYRSKLFSIGTKFCALAVMIAGVLSPVCRGGWYQPEEPKNLKELLER